MTGKRDLGPILALAGSGIALAAVIAGFLITGGPGDARDRRLDGMVQSHMYNLTTMAACAYAVDGAIPASREALEIVVEQVWPHDTSNIDCSTRDYPHTPETAVEYSRIDASTLKLCGTFRLPAAEQKSTHFFMRFPVLRRARPAGYECYELDVSVIPRTPSR
jgi:hypothetical protein